MKVIGINYLSESSVCLVENGIVKYAISEERLNRKKNWYGIPYASIKKLLKDTKNKISDIDLFATCGLSSLVNDVPDIDYLKTRSTENNREQLNVENDVYNACRNSHAVVILTEWDEFLDLNWKKIYVNMNKPAFIFDGRRLLEKDKLTEIGFKYYQIGS